ncbi:MAG: patatin-like phospholipase family protein [Oscillospiraceae bacterium]|jgi:NTE family protein|nr:patatin-like phospholipase family protein [Oscillospiraceae bacterium]
MLGIALEGGGARCAAQAGALTALVERGFQPECVAGCGGGAWVAGLFALGIRGDSLLRLVRDMRKAGPWMLSARACGLRMFIKPKLSEQGALSASRIHRVLRWQTLDTNLPDLKMPLAVAVWDVEAGEELTLSSKLPSGPSSLCWNRQATLAQAIGAAVCVPGLLPPVSWRGRTLTGGASYWSTLPDALRDLGADSIIRMRVIDIRDSGLDAASIAQANRLPRDHDEDGLLRISLPARAGLMDFEACELYYEIGYRACLEALPKLIGSRRKIGGNVLPFPRM